MKEHHTVRLLASVFLMWTSLSIGDAAATGSDTTASTTDPRLDMVAELKALDPHPSLGDQAKVFGRFIGTWDGEYTEFSNDGKVTRSSGEWVFGWVMDGRAIQDLFIIRPSAAHPEGFVGTTLRFFDSKSQTWSVTFIDPENNSVATLTGAAVGGDRIVFRRSGSNAAIGQAGAGWSRVRRHPTAFVSRSFGHRRALEPGPARHQHHPVLAE